MPMTIFEAIMVSISFSTLIVSVIALSFTFTQKK
ncbi:MULTISPECIES: putative holin-like toxin [unclassified Lysinibacillus]